MSCHVYPRTFSYRDTDGVARIQTALFWTTYTRKGDWVIKVKSGWDDAWSTLCIPSVDYGYEEASGVFWEVMRCTFLKYLLTENEDFSCLFEEKPKIREKLQALLERCRDPAFATADWKGETCEILKPFKFKFIGSF